jgi:hypothetical protein
MSFQTSDSHASAQLQPVRVAALAAGVFEEARTLAAELPGWRVLESDESAGRIVCSKDNGLLRGSARITITVQSPPGIPSTTVNVQSESSGGLLSADRANVAQFVRLFQRRVCL